MPDIKTVQITKAPIEPFLEQHCELGIVWVAGTEILVPENPGPRIAWPWLFHFQDGKIVGDMSLAISRKK